MSFLRFLMLLSLVVWVGGIIFFSLVAPAAFHFIPARLLAGTLVGNLLAKLHWIALGWGIVFLISSIIYNRMAVGSPHVFAVRHTLVGMMLALTLISQFWITPRMAALRGQVSSFDTAATISEPARMQFDALHVWSTRLEVTVLLLGLIVIWLTANALAANAR